MGKDLLMVPVDPRYQVEKRPLITNEMKAVCIGEFSFHREACCVACAESKAYPNCVTCGGEIEYLEEITVPWTTCKEIYKAMAMQAAKAA